MSKYVTRQRKILLSYLRSRPDRLLSAQEIAGALEADGVSLSAVYRNLTELEQEGSVRRSRRGGGREAGYQFLDAAPCRECLHLSCTRCGRTVHMDTDEARQLISAVAARDGFAIDKAETVLYGVCQTCQNAPGQLSDAPLEADAPVVKENLTETPAASGTNAPMEQGGTHGPDCL